MKRYTIAAFLILFIGQVFAQQANVLRKGNKVFVENKSKNENAIKTAEELHDRLKEWSYWEVVPNEAEADFKVNLETTASKGITLTSWGGTSYVLVAKLQDKGGEILWESNAYKSSPNGTNGFNSGRAVVKKLMRDLKKKFKEEG